MIDGDPDNLLKTDGVNPLVVTMTFREPIQLRAAQAYMAASPYDWVLEAQPGEERLLAANVPERQWTQISLPAAVETNVVRIEILRLERDDYVHANEIELYGPSAQPLASLRRDRRGIEAQRSSTPRRVSPSTATA